MSQFLRTIRNCIMMGSLSPRLFRLLYAECPIPISREFGSQCHIWYNEPSGRQWIVIGFGQAKKESITALLHEIGHYVDFKSLKNFDQGKYMRSEKVQKVMEKKAWKNAIRLSDKYGIDICYKTAVKWLGTYGASYKTLSNRACNQKE